MWSGLLAVLLGAMSGSILAVAPPADIGHTDRLFPLMAGAGWTYFAINIDNCRLFLFHF